MERRRAVTAFTTSLLVLAISEEVWYGVATEPSKHWETLEEKFDLSSRSDFFLRIGIAPHKMRLTGEDLEASAPGAGKRADFLLLAYKRGENPHPLQQKPMQ